MTEAVWPRDRKSLHELHLLMIGWGIASFAFWQMVWYARIQWKKKPPTPVASE
jgi:hypothetical protein